LRARGAHDVERGWGDLIRDGVREIVGASTPISSARELGVEFLDVHGPRRRPRPAAELSEVARNWASAPGASCTVTGSRSSSGWAPDGRLIFVGEAPGADEDARASLSWRAGQLLTKIIQAMVQREDVTSATSSSAAPQQPDAGEDEILACQPFLLKQLRPSAPVHLRLGRACDQTLLKTKERFRACAGGSSTITGSRSCPRFTRRSSCAIRTRRRRCGRT